MPFPLRDGLQGLHFHGPRKLLDAASEILSWTSAPPQSCPNTRRCPYPQLPGDHALGFPPNAKAATSLRFLAHSASSHFWQRLSSWACYFPTTSVLRFSQPLNAFIRQKSAGLISCQIRSWTFPPKLFPLVQPYIVSNAVPLLTFLRLQGFPPLENPPSDLVV
jgi:hypothetical protein